MTALLPDWDVPIPSTDKHPPSCLAPPSQALMACGKPPCVQHGDLCAYHGDEEDRCPWCHSTWSRIIATGWHSCQRRDTWTKAEREWRTKRAAQMREKAAQDASLPDRSVHCAHPGQDAWPGLSSLSQDESREDRHQ